MLHRSALFLVVRRPNNACWRSFHVTTRICSSTEKPGRRRFYKHVGTTTTCPPWQDDFNKSIATTVDSPVSAGVDDTQSASGVTTTLVTDNLQHMLEPRNPITNIPLDENSSPWHGITLDKRYLKTPLGQSLAVPSEYLAWAIAAEWDAQETTIRPAQMPLMTLTCTALDQVAHHPQAYRDEVLRFLGTDTTCYWADPIEDRVLYRNQQESWSALHDYVENRFSSKPAVAVGTAEHLVLSRARSSTQKSSGLPHGTQLYDAAKTWVDSLDAWHLVALHSVASESKSFFVGMAVVTDGISLQEAIAASRVEEEFQISTWGLVEGGHDYDRLNCSIQIRAAHLLVSSIAANYNTRKY